MLCLIHILFLIHFSGSSSSTLTPIIQTAGNIAFNHIGTNNEDFRGWLHAFAVLHGYAKVAAQADFESENNCPCSTEMIPPQCHQQRQAACLFSCIATTQGNTEVGAMAHLALANAYRHGHFPGSTASGNACFSVEKEQNQFLKHLRVATQFATRHVQRGLAKSQEWVPIYDDFQLARSDKKHQEYGSDLEEQYRLLERGGENDITAFHKMTQLSAQIATTKYHGSHAHTMSQKEACEWYERSVHFARKTMNMDSNKNEDSSLFIPVPKTSVVMLAQCFTSGTDGFTKDEGKGVKLLRECVGPRSEWDNMMQGHGDGGDDDKGFQARRQCMSLLGTFTLWGDHGVEQDIDLAETLLTIAAETGEAFASYGLGMMYFLGYRNNTNVSVSIYIYFATHLSPLCFELH